MAHDIVRKLGAPKLNRFSTLAETRKHVRSFDADDGQHAESVVFETHE
jgi:hypothetical protein